ncbi:uncharacterized protein LOC129743253 [Uranotaenia lowii]|uniref:uncharacterized protein LOC129743253 n=1 Tax=Uranotaenia lowii TaxID=190385 RepID=UPI0024796934|nr:uncharacterized protein LOC129743253 [Uranotaenia lowii]
MPPWLEEKMDQLTTIENRPNGSAAGKSTNSLRTSISKSSSRLPSVVSSSRLRLSSVSLMESLVSSRVRWLIALMTLLSVLSSAEGACWWNPSRAECVPCTVCGEQQLVLRPCQEYMDTVCGTMKDLDMDLDKLTREHSKPGHKHHHHDGQGQPHPRKENTEEIMWDWQAASLLLAIIGCLLFFFAAAIIALNQTRQWKRIEKHFDADMEALSAQLMNHLSSMQQLENGSLFLDDVIGHHPGGRSAGGGGGAYTMSPTAGIINEDEFQHSPRHHHQNHQQSTASRQSRRFRRPNSSNGDCAGIHQHCLASQRNHPIEVRCVYLDQLLDDKNCSKPQGPGNLYIEENITERTQQMQQQQQPTSLNGTVRLY